MAEKIEIKPEEQASSRVNQEKTSEVGQDLTKKTSEVEQKIAMELSGKNKTYKRKILVGVLGVLVITGIAFRVYKLKLGQERDYPVPVGEPTPALTSEVTQAEIRSFIRKEGDWNKYINETYQFEIRYPADWQLTENPNPTLSSGGLVKFSGDGNSISIFPFLPQYGVAGENISEISVKKETINIGKYSSEKETWLKGEEILEEHAVLEIDDKNFYFLIHYKNDKYNEETASIFSFMLSAFRFLEKTKEWKTYTNTKYGYSIKYPDNWTINRGPGNSSDAELAKMRSVSFYASEEISPGVSLLIDTNELHSTGEQADCLSLSDCVSKVSEALPTSETQNSTFLEESAVIKTYDRITESYTQTNYHLFFMKDKNFYHVHFYSPRESYVQNKKILDLVLSTFEFLE